MSGTAGDSLALQHTISGVDKGKSYGLRYRAKNLYGWSSDWSPIVYIITSDPPSMPSPPTLDTATDTSITLSLYLPPDDGGLSLTSLELWRDEGNQDGSPSNVEVTTYDAASFSLSHELTTTLDGIVTGKVYSFRTRAINPKGASEFSELLLAAVASPPARPNAPIVDRTHSGSTSLFIKWSAGPLDPSKSPGGDIIGY